MGMHKVLEEQRREEEELISRGLNKVRIPAYMREAIIAYVVQHRRPSHFLTAFLSNDLMIAISCADDDNIRAFRDWMLLVHNYTPSACHGSPDKVKAWVDQGVDGVEKGNGI